MAAGGIRASQRAFTLSLTNCWLLMECELELLRHLPNRHPRVSFAASAVTGCLAGGFAVVFGVRLLINCISSSFI